MTAFPPAEQPVSFRHPPVMEVAFALQFATGVIDLDSLGEIARQVGPSFPNKNYVPALPPLVEEFAQSPVGPRLIFQSGPALPRTWFVSKDGATLLQVQADRLGYNWRRADLEERDYPRYGQLRADLIKHVLPAADEVVKNVPTARINLIELTYVNQLRTAEPPQDAARPPLRTFLRPVDSFTGEFLGEPEDARLQARWRIPGGGGEPIGRLYASAEPAFLLNQTPIYQLVLTARLVAPGVAPTDTVKLFDVAHNWIVRGFKDLTTDDMHETWELEGAP